VRDYFLENSNGQFTIDVVGVLGWYDADKPAEHYWKETPQTDPNDSDHDGWLSGHAEKWAEAIRKADQEFDFSAYDANRDGRLAPDELGVLIVIPSTGPFGTVRPVVGRQYPSVESLVVDRVRVDVMAEYYTGHPANLGVPIHELSHLLLGTADMYFTFFCSTAAGDASIMDAGYGSTHLDAFHKLKLGWLHPKVILRSGRYELESVEQEPDVWILLDPDRRSREYFIVENRWGGESYDRTMADDGGLAVWHVMEDSLVYGTVPPPPFTDPQKWASITPGDWGRRAVRMIRPTLEPPFQSWRALWDGAQPGADYDLLSDNPNPYLAELHWADGSPSGFNLRAVSEAGPKVTAEIDTP
jgi:M6 family metalloprotease-like protein